MSTSSTELNLNTKEIEKALEKAKQKHIAEAALTMQGKVKEKLTGSRSGEQYRVPGTNTFYTASAEGEPPASRTGRLRQSIEFSYDGTGFNVGTNLFYAKHLELGTSRMGPRPFIRPAFNENMRTIIEILGQDWSE